MAERSVDIESYTAAHGRATLVLAHGAGAGQRHPFLVHFARELAARDVDVFTFDFLYMQRGRKLPDKNDALEACWRAAIAEVRARAKQSVPFFLGGKSMGGRIASQVAGQGEDATHGPVGGLVFLGYPLHPPTKPAQLRSEHLPRVRAPMLFCQGERDPFGTPDELGPIVRRLHAGTEIVAVEGGDHSFAVPRRLGVSQDVVYARVLDAIVRWMTRVSATSAKSRGPRPRGRARR